MKIVLVVFTVCAILEIPVAEGIESLCAIIFDLTRLKLRPTLKLFVTLIGLVCI